MSITQVSLEDLMRESPGLDKQAIADLKKWNSQETHLPALRDADLALFYLNNTYDVEATKKNINNYFLMRHHAPELFVKAKDLQSPELKKIFDSVFVVSLPKRTRDNHKVILATLMDPDPAKYNFENAAKVMNMVIDTGVYEDGYDNKYVFVFDIRGGTMDHRNTLSWMGLKKFYDYMHKGSPMRWVGAHYINTGNGDGSFRDFVKSKIVDANFVGNKMIQFHTDMENLLNATGMDRSMLPKEMGGEAGPALELQRKQVKKLESHDSFFVNLSNKMKLKNTEKIPSAHEVFGPEKTF